MSANNRGPNKSERGDRATLYFSAEQLVELKAAAEEMDRPMSWIVSKCLVIGLGQLLSRHRAAMGSAGSVSQGVSHD